MSIPITGIVLIPLGLLLALLPWRYCLIGIMTFAMMSPAAVVNVGSFGVQPGYYLSALLIGRTAAEVMVSGFQLNAFVLGRMRPLFYFLIMVFLVLFIALCFFQGQVETLPGSSGFKSDLVHPFRLSRENFTQVAYAILNTGLVYVMGHQGARRPVLNLLKQWDTALVCGLCFAAGVCLWQFVSLYAGIPFPSDFFYSNAGYNRADSQEMVGLFRINGPFEEPSTLGYTFTGYLLFAWLRYRLYPTAFSVILIAACIFCMLVSTSTTAFFGIFLFGCTAVFDVVSARLSLLTRDFKLSSGQIAAIVIVIFGILGGSIVVASNWQAIHFILESTILHKSQSTSFQQRSFADLLAMRIFVQTYGIGVGLGSHKANSMLLTLLSNTGILGFACFGAFVVSLLRRVAPGRDAGQTEFLRRSMRPFQWGLLGLILIHVFSNPNLSTMTLWAEMGGMIALHAALHRAALRQPNPRAPSSILSRIRGTEPLPHRIRNARRPLAS